MKKYLLLLAVAFAMGCTTDACAQGWLKNLGKKAVERAKDRAKEKVEQKVENAVDNVVDGTFEAAEEAVAEGLAGGEDGQAEAEQPKTQQPKPQEQPQAAPKSQAPMPAAGTEAAPSAPQAAPLEMTYAKSDFVRGDEVFFEDNLSGEQMGEFPSRWDLLEESAEVSKLNGENVIIPSAGRAVITPLFKEGRNYLPEKFTLEFDMFMPAAESWKYVEYHLYLSNADGTAQEIGFTDYGSDEHAVYWGYEVAGRNERREGKDEGQKFMRNSWNHVALSFNQRALKIYVNGVRYANIPNTVRPEWFSLGLGASTGGWESHRWTAVKNICLAKGAVPLYDRMMNEGKFITYGITFDVGKSVVKPESMGEIARIVQLLNENPSLKFSVEGHTDSTGNAASNQKLSEARSQAIVAKLVEQGIAQDRLTAVGKGQNNPIADNATDEGRAKNRRVEFVKM